MSCEVCNSTRCLNETNVNNLQEARSLFEEMLEAWEYFSEYDVPIGMKESIEKLLLKL